MDFVSDAVPGIDADQRVNAELRLQGVEGRGGNALRVLAECVLA
ncbi:hypothetical protein [Burkholderia pseudomallei]|nr:hypothetical protein [Burkholderia pseudomallei]